MDLREIILEVRQATGNRDRSPSTAEIRALGKKIKKQQLDMRPVVNALLEDRSIGALKLALSLMPTDRDRYRKELAEVVELSDHENWEIREYAADALAAILSDHFEELEDFLHDLRSSDSGNVRRAVVVALKYLGKERNLKRCEALLKIVSAFMNDDSAYVQKNLGAFAIGDGLIEYCPRATIAMLQRLSRSKSPIARWNVASVFTAATATNFFEEIKSELLGLLCDSEPRVRNTALRAVRKIAQRQPDSRKSIKQALKDKAVLALHSIKARESVMEACND